MGQNRVLRSNFFWVGKFYLELTYFTGFDKLEGTCAESGVLPIEELRG